jgi:hypothetical protein
VKEKLGEPPKVWVPLTVTVIVALFTIKDADPELAR